MHLDAYSQVTESAKISGVALIPRISRNNNLYTKQELERFDGVTVPLNWEHNPDKKIGSVTFRYNPSQETVFYEGEITDESASMLAKNKVLFTSIEATPTGVKEICNLGSDCFAMPFGLKPEGLALTETPGVPETTVRVIENYIRECNHHEYDKYEKGQRFDDYERLEKKLEALFDIIGIEECQDCHEYHLKKN